jgi:hypothetical protein
MIPVKVRCRVWHRSSVSNKEFDTEVSPQDLSDSTRSSNKDKFSAWCANFFPGADKVEFSNMSRR